MAKLEVLNWDKKKVGDMEVSADVVEREVKKELLHTVVRWQLACRRKGTHATKTRAMVRGGGRKPFKQKGTGNARAGDKKSPIWVGGGTIFGPKPRDYSYTLPKKVKRLAMKSLLSLSVKEERLIVVEDFTIENGRTKELASIVQNFVTDKKRTVLILKDDDVMLRRAARNIPFLKVLSYNRLSAKELLYGRKVLMLESAAMNLNEFFGDK
mgnify:CR=1 FL=1